MNAHWPIVIHPEMVAAALRNKKHNAYAVFVVCKQIDTLRKGSGLLSCDEILNITQKTLGVSKSQAYRIVSSGYGVFWRPPKNKLIGLFSHAKTYRNLGVDMFDSNPVRMTLGQMGYDSGVYNGTHLKDLFVSMVASWDAGKSPIAIETIGKLTNISPRTVQRHVRCMSSSQINGVTLNILSGYRVKCDNLNQDQANNQVRQLNSCGVIKYHCEPHEGKYAVMERVGNLYTIVGLERLGRRRRHKHMRSMSNQRKNNV